MGLDKQTLRETSAKCNPLGTLLREESGHPISKGIVVTGSVSAVSVETLSKGQELRILSTSTRQSSTLL